MKSLGIIALFFCIWSCGTTRHIPELSSKNIVNKEYDISKSARNIRYIPLEAGDENFGYYIRHVIEAGKFYYITDNYSILKYTSEGKFVCKIGDWGIEPGQYGMYYWMDISPSFDRLYVRTFDDLYEFDANGKLLRKIEIDAPQKASYDPEKELLVVKKTENKNVQRRFYLSTFFITSRNKFLFRNITSMYNDVAVLICDKQLDSIGAIKNSIEKKPKGYSILPPKFYTDRKYYFYQEELSDTLYAITPRLKRKACLIGIGIPNVVTKNVYCFGTTLYDRKSNRAISSPKGIRIQNINWDPLVGVGKRLFLQTSAYNIIANKAYITDPELKRISETLTPESGVVLVEMKIRKLKF